MIKKLKIPKGTSILLNGEPHWAMKSKKDIFFDVDVETNRMEDGVVINLEHEDLLRYQYIVPQLYGKLMVRSIDFRLKDLVEVR